MNFVIYRAEVSCTNQRVFALSYVRSISGECLIFGGYLWDVCVCVCVINSLSCVSVCLSNSGSESGRKEILYDIV